MTLGWRLVFESEVLVFGEHRQRDVPLPFAEIARLAIRTLREVLAWSARRTSSTAASPAAATTSPSQDSGSLDEIDHRCEVS